MKNNPMLNAYPDSIGENLGDIVEFLSKPELKDVFGSFYILPSVFNTDLDRGFSVVDYNLSHEFAKAEDLEKLQNLGIDLKLDFILNHASVLSPQFQDLIKNGENSKYMDLNIKSDLVWEFYDNTLKQLSDYGASIVRLDAFAYAPNGVGEKNFLNDSTWDVLEIVI